MFLSRINVVIRKQTKALVVFAVLFASLPSSCSQQISEESKTNRAGEFVANGKAELWETSPDRGKYLERQADLNLDNGDGWDDFTIKIDSSRNYQIMDGFGASWTDSSAWLWQNKLSDPRKEQLMESLFGKTGIKLSFIRQPMGSSDYSWQAYSYLEQRDDWALSSFSIDRDKSYIIPAIKRSIAKNKDLKVMASPWSPPGWMKTSGSMIGGTLRWECYRIYSEYFVKYVKAYGAEGIPIFAVTMQNEPNYSPNHYPGMKMTAFEQVSFLNNDLGPAFERNNLKTKIIAFDHNFDDEQFPISVLNGSRRYAAGSAWHPYTTANNHRAMTRVHNQFPDKGIWFTEASGGAWHGPNGFSDVMGNTIRAPRNWSRSVIYWNIALDQNNGPSLLGNGSTSTGLVTIRSDRMDDIHYNIEFHALGHSSKFLDKGARRTESNEWPDRLENVAYKNTDGSIVLVLHNREQNEKKIAIQHGNKTIRYKMSGNTATTIKWYP